MGIRADVSENMGIRVRKDGAYPHMTGWQNDDMSGEAPHIVMK